MSTMQTKVQPKRGRPSDYNDEIVDRICQGLADGKSLRNICAESGMPNRATVFRWLSRYEEFRKLHGIAREWQLDRLWDDVIVNVDDRSVDIARKDFVTSTLKRRIARLVPTKYGRPRLGQLLL